jgi:hypothetical protein
MGTTLEEINTTLAQRAKRHAGADTDSNGG